MTFKTNIRSALQSELAAVAGVPEIVKEGGKTYKPVPGTPYIQISLVVESERPSSMGNTPPIFHQGTFEIESFYPSGKGSGALEEMTGLIKDKFYVRRTLTKNGDRVNVLWAEEGIILNHTGWISLNVSVKWNAYSRDS